MSDYIGCNFDSEQYDALMFNRWSETAMRREVSLFPTKWFDHRHLHPVHATYLFGHLFTTEVRSIIRSCLDMTPATMGRDGTFKDWNPIKKGDILEPQTGDKALARWKKVITALIKARQTADTLGIPYSFFIKEGLNSIYFGRFYMLTNNWAGTPNWKGSLPSPMMLNGLETTSKILVKWAEKIDGSIQYALDPKYLVAENESSADIDDHQNWLCQQIHRKTDPKPAIRKFVKMGLLSENFAVKSFGPTRVSQALS